MRSVYSLISFSYSVTHQRITITVASSAFSGSYVNARIELFPTAEWANMTISDAVARLQVELRRTDDLARVIQGVVNENNRQESELNAAYSERDNLVDQMHAIQSSVNELKQTLADLKDTADRLYAEVQHYQYEVANQEFLLTQRRARLQSLANESAQLDSLADQVVRDHEAAHYGLMQGYAIIGAASAARAPNEPIMRTAVS